MIKLICFTDMHETLKSKSRRNTTGSNYADHHREYSRFHLASPKPAHVRKSVASTQLPSTKLGLYKALQPLLKLASPSRLDGLVLLYYVILPVLPILIKAGIVCCYITCITCTDQSRYCFDVVHVCLCVYMCVSVCLLSQKNCKTTEHKLM